jgi:endonuclease/exonuclease/phosphatase (EEP) superfamily protein YafD
VGVLVALALLAGSLVLTLAKVLASDSHWWALAVSFAPFALVGHLLAALLLGFARRRSAAGSRRLATTALAVALVGVVAHAAWLVPSYAGAHPEGDPDLTVLGLNLHYGQADPRSAARVIEGEDPDVIVLSEATPEAVAALAGRGVGGAGSPWPHQGGRPLPSIAGTVVLSAYPLAEQTTLDIATGAHRMRVEAPRPFWLTAVHTTQPLYDDVLWRRDFRVLRADARAVEGPHLEIGDFNATLDHGRMRDLLDTGLHDAAREANSGWQPTWPTAWSRRVGGVPVPIPVMAIDHVLLSEELSAVSTSVHSVSGTDHQALVARLRWG